MTPEWIAHLEASAIPASEAAGLGITCAATKDALPEYAQWIGPDALPALVFHWQGLNGRSVAQVKPRVPLVWGGDEHKYLWPKGESPITHVARARVDNPAGVLIVEGSKQSRAAALYAPAGWTVLGIGGCHNWVQDGFLDPELGVHTDGLDVVVIMDADIRTNLNVWSAGERLRDALTVEGAGSVKFAMVPGTGTAGLDDYLGTRPIDRRSAVLANLVGQAAPLKDRDRPKAKPPQQDTGNDPRPVVQVDADARVVADRLTALLVDAYDGHTLFNHGKVITRIVDGGVDPDIDKWLDDMIAQVAQCVVGRGATPGWPPSHVLRILKSRPAQYSPLERVAAQPFMRLDGTICDQRGYDLASGVYLDSDVAVAVPDHPTDHDIAHAVAAIDDMICDFPFPDRASRANTFALLLTPVVRDFMGVVPLAVIDGLQAGVGKGKLASCMSIIVWGHDTELLPWTGDNAECRKTITGAYKSKPSAIMFDEAHHVEGAALAQALTAATWSDRELGTNRVGAFPNRATWAALGNAVTVAGDIRRRAYRIRLAYDKGSPDTRTGFRHPDLEDWVADNRLRLLSALLTMARAWHDRGQPFDGQVDFGSFEKWQRTIGGILQVCGVDGFLEGRDEWGRSQDLGETYWLAHLVGLYEGTDDQDTGSGQKDEPFTIKDLRSEILRQDEMPPGVSWAEPSLNRSLGHAYSKVEGRWFGSVSGDRYRIVKAGMAHGGRVKWQIQKSGSGGGGGKGGKKTPFQESSQNSVKDLKTGETGAFTGGQAAPDPSLPSGPSDPSDPTDDFPLPF